MADAPSISVQVSKAPSLTLQVPQIPGLTFFAVGCAGAGGGGGGGSTVGGVTSLNGLSGILNIIGAGSVFVTSNGQNIIVSGALSGTAAGGITQAQFDALSGYFSTGLFNTGANLYSLITNASGSLIATINATGVALTNSINSVSGWANNFSGVLQNQITIIGGASGVLQNQINNLNVSLASLSGYTTNLSGVLQNQINQINLSTGNFVTVFGTQDVSGKKTFQSGVKIFADDNSIFLDTATKSFYYSNGNQAIELPASNLRDTVGQYSLNFSFRTLVNANGKTVANWNLNQLWDNNEILTLDWKNRSLTGEWNTNAVGQQPTTVVNWSRLSGMSGYFNALIAAVPIPSGTSINGLSGQLSLIGNGGIAISTSGQTFYVSGANWLTTGAGDIRYYPLGSNPSGYLTSLSGLSLALVTNISGILTTGLFNTGAALYQLTTGLSGYLLSLISSGGASAGVSSFNTATGNVNITGSGNVTVTRQGQLFVISGDTGAYANFATIANLGLTGSNLYNLITGLSGAVNYGPAIAALSGSLNQTGTNLYNFIQGLSGALNVTGSNLYSYITGASGLQSALLAQTGSNLYNLIISSSGYLISLISAASAGVSSINGASGVITVVGAGGIQVITNGQTITVTGQNWLTTGAADNRYYSLNNPSGFITTGQTGQYASAVALGLTGSNLYNLVTGLSGALTGTNYGPAIVALSGSLNQTGSNLYNLIVSLSGVLNASGNQLATNLFNTGSYLYSLITGSSGLQTILLGNTGSYLYNTILGLSGVLNARIGVTSLNGLTGNINLVGTGNVFVTLQGQQIIFSGDTGAYANFATITALAQTGSNLYNLINASGLLNYQITTGASGYLVSLISAASAGVSSINGVSGVVTVNGAGGINVVTNGQTITVSGQNWLTTGAGDIRYYLNSNPSGFITTGQTGQFASVTQLNSLSGFVVTTSGYLLSQIAATSGVLNLSLTQTGANLYTLLTGFSGQANTNYATIINLGLTGSNLYALVTGSSGAQNLAIANTGSNLYNLIVGLSGIVPTIKVTGSNNILAVNITGIGGTQVTYSGGMIYIYSSATATGGGGGSAGVSSINGATGAIIITGNGVTQSGNTITIASSNPSFNGSGECHFVTGILPTGLKEYWINFPITFDALPRIELTQQFRSQGDDLATFYNYGVSGKTTTGFFLMLSDVVRNSGLIFNVLAKTATGSVLYTGGATTSGGTVTIPPTPMRFGLSLDNGTSDVTTGYKGWFQLSSAMQISGWNIISVQSGTILIDVLKSTFANWPNDAVSIISGLKPRLNGLRTGYSVILTGWNTTVHEGEYLQFVVRGVTGVRKFNINISGIKV